MPRRYGGGAKISTPSRPFGVLSKHSKLSGATQVFDLSGERKSIVEAKDWEHKSVNSLSVMRTSIGKLALVKNYFRGRKK